MKSSSQFNQKIHLYLFLRGIRIFVLIFYFLSVVGAPTLVVQALNRNEVQKSFDPKNNLTEQQNDNGGGYIYYLPIVMGGTGTLPEDIILSSNAIDENMPVNAVIGTITTVDPGEGDTFTYSLVAGVGDTDNASFNISGDQLRASEIFNFEDKSNYTIRIQTMDQVGLKYQESFVIEILDVDDPPVANDQTVSTPDNELLSIILTGSDEDDDPLTYLLLSLPVNGALYEDGDPDIVILPPIGDPVRVSSDLVYEPNENFVGIDSFTFQISANDVLSNVATVTINVNDATAPTMNITGATADGSPMDGTLGTGYMLETGNNPGVDRLIQFAAGSGTDELLADEYFGLTLVAAETTVSAAELIAYYEARGVPPDYLTYLTGAANGTNPFVFIKGHPDLSVTLVDGAKHVVGGYEAVDMTVPDDFPLGTYTVEGQIEDEAGNATTVTLILIVSGDREAPELTVTGAMDGEIPMAGTLGSGFILETTNDPAIDHLVQFTAGSGTDELLADEYFGLTLVAAETTVSAAELIAYYEARGVPPDYLTYLTGAANGTNPFVFIKGHSDLSVTLVDGAKHVVGGYEAVDMTVPDDFPLGTYTVTGEIKDLAGNTTPVKLILIVSGDRVAPTLDITGATADGELMGGDLETGYILVTTNDPEIDHLLQFADGTDTSEPLADEYFGLYLVDSTVSPEDLKAYYVAHGTPSSPIDFLSYLQGAADGLNPFVYIKGSTVRLVDAAKWDLLDEEHDMTIPDDFPLGTYTVEGQIEDEAGNQTTVTLILVVTPTLEIDIDHEEGILSGDWEGDNLGGFVGVSAGAALAGTNNGLWADSGEGTSQYAYLNFPQVDTDTMRLRFYIDVQNVTHIPNPADYLHIIGVKTYNENEHICYIRLRHTDLGYFIQLDAKEDGDVDYHLYSTAGSISATAENYVEVMIVRADSGQRNGEAYLWVNGSLYASATDLDNDQQFTNLGFIEAGVFHKNGIWAGNVYLDEIIMNNTGDEIGPL